MAAAPGSPRNDTAAEFSSAPRACKRPSSGFVYPRLARLGRGAGGIARGSANRAPHGRKYRIDNASRWRFSAGSRIIGSGCGFGAFRLPLRGRRRAQIAFTLDFEIALVEGTVHVVEGVPVKPTPSVVAPAP